MNQDKIYSTSIDFLDKALLLLKNESAFGPIGFNRPNLSEVERKLLIRAFYKLEKDGLAYSEKRENGNKIRHQFYISFDGLLALEECPAKWGNKPNRWAAHSKLLNSIWTVAVVINALIALVFTYLTYINKPEVS